MEDEIKTKRGSVYDVDYCPPNRKVVVNRYKNYFVEGLEDGSVKLVEREPVSPSLASEYSVGLNALRTGKEKPLRGRLNVDAVDLHNEVENLFK